MTCLPFRSRSGGPPLALDSYAPNKTHPTGWGGLVPVIDIDFCSDPGFVGTGGLKIV